MGRGELADPGEPGGLDDASLVAAAREGDSRAWDELVRRFAPRVWAVARALGLSEADAADVSQLTWYRAVQNLRRIREPAKVGAWLATTARHEAFRTLRRNGRQVPVGDDAVLDLTDEGAGPLAAIDAGLLRTERHREVWAAVGALPAHCQRLLRILVVEPRPSYLEVSEALGMPVGSIGPTQQRCLQRLRVLLDTGEGPE